MKLEITRMVSWFGEINPESLNRVMDKIRQLLETDSQKDIALLVSSCGGQTGCALGFYDLIRVLCPHIITVGLGDISSSALIIWLAGTRRYITANSSIFLHQISQRYEKDMCINLIEARARVQALEFDQHLYTSVICKTSNGKLNTDDLVKFMERETTLSAQDALRLGLATDIWQ